MPTAATVKKATVEAAVHPLDDLIRTDRIPHIWCPGCGIGTAFSASLRAMQASAIDLQKICMVSGIGCSGRAAGYVNLDSFHTTQPRQLGPASQTVKPGLNQPGATHLFNQGESHL